MGDIPLPIQGRAGCMWSVAFRRSMEIHSVSLEFQQANYLLPPYYFPATKEGL